MVLSSTVEFKTTSTITIRKRIILLSKHPINDMKNPLKKQPNESILNPKP